MKAPARRRNTKRRVLTTFLTFAVLMGLATPAQAASFAWTFNGKCCIESRKFTTTSTTDIWVDVDYVRPNGNEVDGPLIYTFTLFRDRPLRDVQVGSYRQGTGASDFVWKGVTADTFYWRMDIEYPWRDARQWQMGGNTAWGGSRT